MPELYTIGYERESQGALIETLLANDVQTLVDIRELPQSRKPGMSKTGLGAAIRGHGMEYIHVRALGTPRDIRHQRKIDHDQEAFAAAFVAYLDTQDEAMQELVERAQRERCCLMCYEADARICHRWFVSQRAVAMSDGALAVTHLAIGE